jgi:hypothetical protein
MPISSARIVTIISGFETRATIEGQLHDLNIKAFSYAHIKGQGVHGGRHGGLAEGDNIAFTIITSEATAEKLLEWVDSQSPMLPAVAYSVEARTVPSQAKPKHS